MTQKKQEAHAATPENHAHGHDHGAGGALGGRAEIILSLLCGGFLLAGWLLDRSLGEGALWPLALFVGAYLAGGYYSTPGSESAAAVRVD